MAVLLAAQERVVSLSPSITEILFALGKGDEVVGRSSYSLYPKEAQKLPIVGSYVSVDIEKVFALRPTLVIAQKFQQKDVAKLQKLGVRTLYVDLSTIDAIESSIMKLGSVLHVKKRAQELVANIQRAKKNAKRSKEPKRVLIVFGLHEHLRSGIYVSGQKLFYNDILKICGDRNAFSDPSVAQPVLNYEHIVALNPDVIIILHSKASNPNADVKKALHSWLSLPVKAAQDHAIYVVDDDYIAIPSHRVALTIERICSLL